MDDQFFAESADPKEIAERLGLTILGWLDGQLYARGRDQLYQIGPFRPQANYSGRRPIFASASAKPGRMIGLTWVSSFTRRARVPSTPD